jgi:hypothetical protein
LLFSLAKTQARIDDYAFLRDPGFQRYFYPLAEEIDDFLDQVTDTNNDLRIWLIVTRADTGEPVPGLTTSDFAATCKRKILQPQHIR